MKERFNRFTDLGITAEDMKGMLDDRISDYIPDERDFHPIQLPSKK